MELVTERLRLREFVGNDYEAVHRYASDPEVTRFMDWGPNDSAATRLFRLDGYLHSHVYVRDEWRDRLVFVAP